MKVPFQNAQNKQSTVAWFPTLKMTNWTTKADQ